MITRSGLTRTITGKDLVRYKAMFYEGTGTKEVAELKLEQMLSFHEIQPGGKKLGPLGVRIEPAPG